MAGLGPSCLPCWMHIASTQRLQLERCHESSCMLISSSASNTTATFWAVQAVMQRYASVHAAMSATGWSDTEHQLRRSQAGATSASAATAYQQPMQQQIHWAADGRMSVLAFAGPEYELYAVFDAATSKDAAVKISHRLSVWIKSQQAELFMPL